MLAPSLPRTETVAITDADSIRVEWDQLARRAIEPNPYYESGHLIAICRHMLPHEDHRLILVRERASNHLVGLFPVTSKGWRDGFPGGVTFLSFDSLIGQTVPLIAGDDPAAVWAAFLGHVDDADDLPSVVSMKEFYADSECGKALDEACRKGLAIYRSEHSFERAVATGVVSYDTYADRWSRKKARNIRSRMNKLRELGMLELRIVTSSEAAFEETLSEILDLEAAGWKGRAGTALISQEHTLAFARDAYSAGGNAPEVHLATLRLDGKLIAGDLNLISQGRAYFIKSAYDESYSKYGPGVILYTYALEQMLDQNRYERLDSCADAGHPLEEIWLERERVDHGFTAAASRRNQLSAERLIARRARMFAMRDAARKATGLFGSKR